MCGPGQVCSQGLCTSGCAPGETLCPGGKCVDLSKNGFNCGSCDHVCPGDTSCAAGACVCPPGLSLCGAKCVDLGSDPKHCGGCNHWCTGGKVCQQGSCVCLPGWTD
ncbi:MAG: hypothetical protein HY744_17390 [Deltaproteobacteria bacterium]|nr:hypothetical protein [Deltaproteobacteria bacterium]